MTCAKYEFDEKRHEREESLYPGNILHNIAPFLTIPKLLVCVSFAPLVLNVVKFKGSMIHYDFFYAQF